jgi:DNA-binding transcriptional LysR family regulator
MNVKDYEYIVEIADQGSISKAANRLYITQSALTRFLQRIESEVGVPLFYRHGNKFILTGAGQLYVEKGRQIIKLNGEIDSELKLIALNSSNYIRLGCGLGRMEMLVSKVLPAFYGLHPNFRIKLRNLGSPEMAYMVETNQLDLALLSDVKSRSNLMSATVGKLIAALAVPTSSPLLNEAVAEPGLPYPLLRSKRWLKEPYIRVDQGTSSGRIVEEYFRSLGGPPQIILEADNVAIAVKAVEAGLGNAIMLSLPLPDSSIKYCCLPDLNIETRNLNIVWRLDYYINPAVSDLIKIIMEVFA